MMDVEIDDQHAIQAELRDRRRRPHGHVVEDAEAHGPARQGMVSRRTHQAEGVGGFPAKHAANGVDHGPGGQQGDVKTGRTAHRVLVKVAAAGAGEGPNLLDVSGLVNAGQAIPVTRLSRQLPALGRQPGPVEVRLHRPQTKRPFRMGAGLVVLESRISIEECHRFSLIETDLVR